MPTPERTLRTFSSRKRLRAAGVFVALIAVAVALTGLAHAAPRGSQVKGVSAKNTSRPLPAITQPVASGGISRSITVVGVGDSVTSGQNCSCATFVALYASDLAATRGLQTSSVNLGVSGWTSTQLLQAMTQPGTFRDQVAKADIMLVTIGANDLLRLEGKQPAGCPVTC